MLITVALHKQAVAYFLWDFWNYNNKCIWKVKSFNYDEGGKPAKVKETLGNEMHYRNVINERGDLLVSAFSDKKW